MAWPFRGRFHPSEGHMSAFANLPISRKLMAAFAAVVVVIFASSAIVFDRLRVIEWAHDWRVHTIGVLDTLQNAMDAMLDQETGLRGYLITGDEKFLEPYHRGGNAYTAASQKIRDLTSNNPAQQSRTSDNPAQQSRLDELNELARKWRSGFAERAIALMAKFETREDARALEGSTAGKTAMDLIRAKVHEIEGAERDLLAKRDAVQRQAFATAYMMTIVGGAASLIIATLMGVLLTRGIAVPITRMTSAMTTLAKGDITTEVPGVSCTASENTVPVPCEFAYAIWTSWQRSCDRDDQVLMQRGDRVGNVTLGPDRRRRGVGNYREWQGFLVFRRNEILRGESSPVGRSGTRRLRCKVCRDDGSPATRGPRSARARLLA